MEGQASCSTPPATRKARPAVSAPESCGREFLEPGGGGLDGHLSLFLGLLPDAAKGEALSVSAPHTEAQRGACPRRHQAWWPPVQSPLNLSPLAFVVVRAAGVPAVPGSPHGAPLDRTTMLTLWAAG